VELDVMMRPVFWKADPPSVSAFFRAET